MSKALTLEAIAEALYKLRNAWLPGGATYDTAIAALEAIGRVRELIAREAHTVGTLDELVSLVDADAILVAIDGEEKP
jgi:hypothetical protein